MSVELTKLPNGLTVVTHARPEVETVSVGVWIGSGSRSEAAAEHGVAHFLEHMAFKGTARRSARDIAEEIEAVGGDLNAATGIDSTAYYARVMRKDLPLALDILSDILLSPRFDADELAREREVILQEIASSLDQPEEIVFDLAQEAAYPEQPAGRPILGTMASVASFTDEHLRHYLGSHYHGPDMVLAAAGAVDHADLVALAAELFGALPPEPAPSPPSALYQGGVRRFDRAFEQSHLVLAFEAPPYSHPDYVAMQVCAGALGGGMSSRLFQEVRERQALAYTVQAFASGLSDSGTITIYAACGPDRAHELIGVIRDELIRAAEHGFSEAEIDRVKAQAKMGLLTGLESSGARTEQLARQILIYGRPLSTEELVEKVERVDRRDVQRLVAEMLASAAVVSAVGPILHVARFDALVEKFGLASSKAA